MADPASDRTSEFVDAAARMIALPIRPEDLVRVVEDMTRIAAVADFLMTFPLDQEIQPAAVFQP